MFGNPHFLHPMKRSCVFLYVLRTCTCLVLECIDDLALYCFTVMVIDFCMFALRHDGPSFLASYAIFRHSPPSQTAGRLQRKRNAWRRVPVAAHVTAARRPSAMNAFVAAPAGARAALSAKTVFAPAPSTCSLTASHFCLRPVLLRPRPCRPGNARPSSSERAKSTRQRVSMLVDPWSVSPATLDVVAAQFFAVSLFPYLAFLYFLERPQNETPPLASCTLRKSLLASHR